MTVILNEKAEKGVFLGNRPIKASKTFIEEVGAFVDSNGLKIVIVSETKVGHSKKAILIKADNKDEG